MIGQQAREMVAALTTELDYLFEGVDRLAVRGKLMTDEGIDDHHVFPAKFLEKKKGVTETRQLTPLQWQLMMKCWKMNLRPGNYSWWGPMAWRIGSIIMWLYKLRRINGPNFTWPLWMFAGAIPEPMLERMGKIYSGKPLNTKSRQELIASVRPNYWPYFRADNGDLPEGHTSPPLPVVSAEAAPV